MFDLTNLFLFSGLDAAVINEFISTLEKPRKYKSGEIIYKENSFSHSLGIFLKGKGVAKSNSVTKNFFFEGSTFGVAALFGNHSNYASTIISKGESTVLFIPEEKLDLLFKTHPQTALNYISFLTEKIRFLNNKIDIFAGDSAKDKIYKYLCDKSDSDATCQIKSMTALCSATGVGKTTLYRVINELEESGSIKRENKKFYIL